MNDGELPAVLPLPKRRLGVNEFLLRTMHHDPNTSDQAKMFFKALCDDKFAREACLMDCDARDAAELLAELIERNYVYIEGIGSWTITPPDRRSLKTKAQDFFGKFFGRKPSQ